MNRWVALIPRWMPIVFVAGGSIGVHSLAQQSPSSQPPAVSPERAAIDRYCAGCHNEKLKTGGLALDAFSPASVNQHPEAWEKVVRKLRARMMPPIGMPRPDERSYDALVSSIAASLDSAAAAHPNPGRTDTFRRLNRTEY